MFSSWNPFRRSREEEDGYARSGGQAGEEDAGIKITVKFERDRYNIPIPKPSLTTVSTLIQTLSTQIGIPTTQLKLIHNGAVLKASSATISSCGIKDGSTLVVVGANSIPSSGTGEVGTAPIQQKKKKEVVPTTDEGLVEYVNGKAGVVDELANDVDEFQRNVNAYLASKKSSSSGNPEGAPPESVPTLTALHQTHMRLSELLLQGLLRLDSIDVPSHFTQSRAARKEAVRKVQNALNIVDGGWKEAKSAHGQASA